MVKAGALWKNKDKDGKIYLSGNLGSLRVLVFPNNFKTEGKHPDYTLCFDENKPKEATLTAAKDDLPEPWL